jgi:hypothetical protein
VRNAEGSTKGDARSSASNESRWAATRREWLAELAKLPPVKRSRSGAPLDPWRARQAEQDAIARRFTEVPRDVRTARILELLVSGLRRRLEREFLTPRIRDGVDPYNDVEMWRDVVFRMIALIGQVGPAETMVRKRDGSPIGSWYAPLPCAPKWPSR